MKPITRTLTFISDPGHGWLSVKPDDLLLLGIQDKISSYSYQTPTRVYLEEDQDAPLFEQTAKAQGWILTLKETYQGKTRIRSLAPYNSYWVTHPLDDEMKVKSHNGKTYLISISPKYVYLNSLSHNSPIYRLPKSNPFRYILPYSENQA